MSPGHKFFQIFRIFVFFDFFMFVGAPSVVGGSKFDGEEISTSRKFFWRACSAKNLRIVRLIVRGSSADRPRGSVACAERSNYRRVLRFFKLILINFAQPNLLADKTDPELALAELPTKSTFLPKRNILSCHHSYFSLFRSIIRRSAFIIRRSASIIRLFYFFLGAARPKKNGLKNG